MIKKSDLKIIDEELIRDKIAEKFVETEELDRKMLENLVFDFMNQSQILNWVSAPQLGINTRMFQIKMQDGMPMSFFNPEIIEYGDQKVNLPEISVFYPEHRLMVKRPWDIVVKFEDVNGEEKEFPLNGLSARLYQQLLGYLNGVVMKDNASSKFKWDRACQSANKKLNKKMKNYK